MPLLVILLDRVVRTTRQIRWVWAASAVTVYLAVFMWLHAWLYQTSHQLSAQYPTYVAAFEAAIETMTKADKLLAVAPQPALFVTVVLTTIALTTVDSRLLAMRMTPQAREGDRMTEQGQPIRRRCCRPLSCRRYRGARR